MKMILDCEVYTNYFLIAFKSVDDDRVLTVEMFNDNEPTVSREKVLRLLSKNTSITFNGNNYDMPMISLFLDGYRNSDIKYMSDKIITSNDPSWKVLQDSGITIPKQWDHIDLIEVAPGQASLKVYGGRMGLKKLQDLPIEPSAIITEKQRLELVSYCGNDLIITENLFKTLEKEIKLRVTMSNQYQIDLRSKSDAQIAETVIKSEYIRLTGKTVKKSKSIEKSFSYDVPPFISFETENLKNLLVKIKDEVFEVKPSTTSKSKIGKIDLPKWMRETPVIVDDTPYKLGIGGLHSQEKSRSVYKGNVYDLIDMDVASYYPNIILEQGLYPQSFGKHFLEVYKSLVERRLLAKKRGDKTVADTLKICINGSFGKFGSVYSSLYSPKLLIQTTLTGQLALLMLIERMTLAGINVLSANTDGIVLNYHRNDLQTVNNIAFNWMVETSYQLEDTHYTSVHSRDVNNYIAVGVDKSVKGKGIFNKVGLMKNPDTPIVWEAIKKYVSENVDVQETIKNCKHIADFCKLRKVTGGATWRDQDVGKTVRFYYSTECGIEEFISYNKNGNKVPSSDGAKPCLELPDILPNDIDYDRYYDIAMKNLKLIGVDYDNR